MESYEFTSMSGKPHNTFNGVHTKYRLPLTTDHMTNQQNGGLDLGYYTQTREHRRAMSVEPTQTAYATMDRVRRDASKDRRKRNISGERHRRGVSVDRNVDKRCDKSSDRTRSELNLHKRREISVERGLRRDNSADRVVGDTLSKKDPSVENIPLPTRKTSVENDNDSDSDTEGGNYVRLQEPLNPPSNVGRQASRQTSSESTTSVFERNTTPRSSNTSRGRPGFTITTSPGYSRVNYGDASPHYSTSSMHHGSQQLYGQLHTSPLPNRHNSANNMNLSSSSSGEANDYVNVNWKPDEPPDEPPPRPPRPTRLDIKHQPNCGSPGPPKTQPRLSRSQAGTPQSNDELRTRFSPGGSPPPPTHHHKTLLTIEVDEKKASSLTDNRKPSLPPKPCPGTQHTVPSTPNADFM